MTGEFLSRATNRSCKVMWLANQEAICFKHQYVGTEHILLGLVKEGSGVASYVLKNLGLDRNKIRLEIEKLVKSGIETIDIDKVPLMLRPLFCPRLRGRYIHQETFGGSG